MSYTYNSAPGYAPAPQDPAQETDHGKALKASLGSGIFLVAVICYTLTLAISLYNALAPSSITGILRTVFQYISQLGLDGASLSESDINSILSSIPTTGLVIGSVTALIPTIVVTLGLWLTWVGARKQSSRKGTAGLTILQVIAVISLIGLIFLALIMVALMIPAITGGKMLDAYLELSGAGTAVIVVVFVFIIALLIFEIVYYIKLIGVYSGAKSLARNERVTSRVSMFVIVIGFISLVGSLITLVSDIVVMAAASSIVSSISNAAGTSLSAGGIVSLSSILSIASALLTFLYDLFLVITYLKLRSAEEPFMHTAHSANQGMPGAAYNGAYPGGYAQGYNGPVYGAPNAPFNGQMPNGQFNGQFNSQPNGQFNGQPGQGYSNAYNAQAPYGQPMNNQAPSGQPMNNQAPYSQAMNGQVPYGAPNGTSYGQAPYNNVNSQPFNTQNYNTQAFNTQPQAPAPEVFTGDVVNNIPVSAVDGTVDADAVNNGAEDPAGTDAASDLNTEA